MSVQAKAGVGCSFAPRCPHAFDPCLQAEPPLYRIHPHQACTCYRYQDQPVLAWAAMDSAFRKEQASAPQDAHHAEKEGTATLQ
jgi:hypothetical protein